MSKRHPLILCCGRRPAIDRFRAKCQACGQTIKAPYVPSRDGYGRSTYRRASEIRGGWNTYVAAEWNRARKEQGARFPIHEQETRR